MAQLARLSLAVIVALLISVVSGLVPSDTQIGSFGALVSYQPVDNWIYPVDEDIPIQISLGNASLAFDFGFQMTYGLISTSSPDTFMPIMKSFTVPQQAQLFNFTGNLLANTFWWNTTVPGIPAGNYVLRSSASFFSCSQGSADIRTDTFWSNEFTVGDGGTVPAVDTGNSLVGGNSSAITAGMYDCTALKFSRERVSIGVVSTYSLGLLLTIITMVTVSGRNPTNT